MQNFVHAFPVLGALFEGISVACGALQSSRHLHVQICSKGQVLPGSSTFLPLRQLLTNSQQNVSRLNKLIFSVNTQKKLTTKGYAKKLNKCRAGFQCSVSPCMK